MSNSGAYRHHDNATTRTHGKISILTLYQPLSMTDKFCEHVYDLSELIKGIGRSNAMQGLHLIAVTQGLFVTSLGGPDLFVKNQEGVLQMCPVRQMFASHHTRLMAYAYEDAGATSHGTPQKKGDTDEEMRHESSSLRQRFRGWAARG